MVRITRSQMLEPECCVSEHDSAIAAGSSHACSQSLGCIVPQQMQWMTARNVMADNYIPCNNERKQHPEHAAL